MELIIKSMALENFKGVKNTTYTFEQLSKICGANGTGKTTIADAHNWLWFDKNYNGKSNPPIRTEGAEEMTPVVTENVEIDGKPVMVSKSQTMATKGSKVSLTNNYTINGVPKSESAFKEYMSALGVDFTKMYTLSHPEAFMEEDKKEQRKILFGMTSDITDKDIAEKCDGCSEVASMLENYTVEEITALQNQTLRKIKDEYGAKGEILRAKMEGLMEAKIDVDAESIEKQKMSITTEIEELKVQKESLKLQFIDTAEQDRIVNASEMALDKAKFEMEQATENLGGLHTSLTKASSDLRKATEDWNNLKNETFDDGSLVCPTCGQTYSEDKQREIKIAFQQRLAAKAEDIKTFGTKAKADVTSLTERVEKQKGIVAEKTQAYENAKAEDIKARETVAGAKGNNEAINKQVLDISFKIQSKEQELRKLDGDLASISNNDRIDIQIDALRADQDRYESERAKAESILEQIKEISKMKNEFLVEEVNKHFEMASFVLFMTQKNGETKDDCRLVLDGYEFGKSANRGREILAKLDVIRGLQRFYGQTYPVFLDNAESLSQATTERIDMPYQLITLSVTEDSEVVVNG